MLRREVKATFGVLGAEKLVIHIVYFLKSVTNIRNPKVEESEELENDLVVNRRIVTLNTIYCQNRKNRRIGE